jgi:hypothetical protein
MPLLSSLPGTYEANQVHGLSPIKIGTQAQANSQITARYEPIEYQDPNIDFHGAFSEDSPFFSMGLARDDQSNRMFFHHRYALTTRIYVFTILFDFLWSLFSVINFHILFLFQIANHFSFLWFTGAIMHLDIRYDLFVWAVTFKIFWQTDAGFSVLKN